MPRISPLSPSRSTPASNDAAAPRLSDLPAEMLLHIIDRGPLRGRDLYNLTAVNRKMREKLGSSLRHLSLLSRKIDQPRPRTALAALMQRDATVGYSFEGLEPTHQLAAWRDIMGITHHQKVDEDVPGSDLANYVGQLHRMAGSVNNLSVRSRLLTEVISSQHPELTQTRGQWDAADEKVLAEILKLPLAQASTPLARLISNVAMRPHPATQKKLFHNYRALLPGFPGLAAAASGVETQSPPQAGSMYTIQPAFQALARLALEPGIRGKQSLGFDESLPGKFYDDLTTHLPETMRSLTRLGFSKEQSFSLFSAGERVLECLFANEQEIKAMLQAVPNIAAVMSHVGTGHRAEADLKAILLLGPHLSELRLDFALKAEGGSLDRWVRALPSLADQGFPIKTVPSIYLANDGRGAVKIFLSKRRALLGAFTPLQICKMLAHRSCYKFLTTFEEMTRSGISAANIVAAMDKGTFATLAGNYEKIEAPFRGLVRAVLALNDGEQRFQLLASGLVGPTPGHDAQGNPRTYLHNWFSRQDIINAALAPSPDDLAQMVRYCAQQPRSV